MSGKRSPPQGPEELAWKNHNLSQLEYFRSLTLREKLEAMQGMADVARRLLEMRRRGELKTSPESGRVSAAPDPSADLLDEVVKAPQAKAE